MISPNAIHGVVENGHIRLDGDVRLPEKTRVLVVVAEAGVGGVKYVRSPKLAHSSQAAEFRKQVVELPIDAKQV